jgi:hypothetical protein
MTTIWQSNDGSDGEWTPDLTFVTPGTQTFVKDLSSFGVFSRIGQRVFCDMFLYYSAFAWIGAAGSAYFTGLPYTCARGACGTFGMSSSNSFSTAIIGLFANVAPGAKTFSPYMQLVNGDGPLSTIHFPTATPVFMRASFNYLTSDV